MKNLKKIIKNVSIVALVSVTLAGCGNPSEKAVVDYSKIAVKGTMKAELTAPPFVPASVGDRPAKKLIVNMEILEKGGILKIKNILRTKKSE